MARSRLAARAAATTVALGLALTAAGCSGVEGPLQGKATGTVFEAKVGDHLFWGPIQLQAKGLDPVTIERIEAISDDPQVKVDRTYRDISAQPTAGGGRRLQDKFRSGQLLDAKELGIAPRSFTTGGPVDVVVVFRPPTRPGPYAWKGFRITYRARGRTQELDLTGPGTACVDRPRSTCSLER